MTGHVGVVAQHLGHGRDVLATEEADLPGGDGHVFEDVPRLLGDAVVIERAVLEALGRVAQDHGGDDGQAMRPHGRNGGHIAGQATGAGGVARIEGQYARGGPPALPEQVVLCGIRESSGTHGVEGFTRTQKRMLLLPCVCPQRAHDFAWLE